MKPYTFRDWREAHRGQTLFAISTYRDLGWRYFGWRPWRMFRSCGWLPDLAYYLRCRAWTRWHVIRVRTLPPTYSDPRERFLHAAFEILRATIVDEQIIGYVAADGDPRDGRSWAWALAEMRALWTWWTVDRPAREAEYARRLDAWDRSRERDVARDRAAHPERWVAPGPVTRDGQRIWPSGVPDDDLWQSAETQSAWEMLRAFDDEVRADEDDAMLRRLVAIRQYLWT